MATEGTMRLASTNDPGKWPVNKDAAGFCSTSNKLAPEDLSLLLGGQIYHGSRVSGHPSRCGSAPPSMEGSHTALGFLKKIEGFEGLAEAAMFLPEDQLRSHPAYSAYYHANVNRNPRVFPPPFTSDENRNLQNANVVGDYIKVSSFDGSSHELFFSRTPLPTHREEADDEKSPRTDFDDSLDKKYDDIRGKFGPSLHGRHKSLVDLIQSTSNSQP